MRQVRQAPTCGVVGAVHALSSARLAAHAGDGRRRKTAAEGLVQQQYVYGAALDIHSIMIAALLLAYPTSPSLTTRTYADSGSLKVQRYLDTISDRIEITRSTSEVKTKKLNGFELGRSAPFQIRRVFRFHLYALRLASY